MAEYVAPGGAAWWWLFWFVAALLLYGILGVWFVRHGQREDREQSSTGAGGVDAGDDSSRRPD